MTLIQRLLHSQRLMLRGWPSLSLVMMVAIASGCRTAGPLERVNPLAQLRKSAESALTSDRLSEYTMQVIRVTDLEKAAEKDPRAAIAELRRQFSVEPRRDVLYALAELCFYVGSDAESGEDRRWYYVSAARFSYGVLFDLPDVAAMDEFDPRFRLAADFYNRSLAELFRAWRGDEFAGKWVAGPFGVVGGQGEIALSKLIADDPGILKQSRAAFDYEVHAFDNRHRRFGLGLPLILPAKAVKSFRESGGAASQPTGEFYPKDAGVVAVSLFLRFEDVLSQGQVKGVLELHDAQKSSAVVVRNRRVPLEADFTVPFASVLEAQQDQAGPLSVFRFFRGDKIADRRGLYMLEPYDPNKIPVVLVHGLLSSPMTWFNLLNELATDPEISSRYQFWFFFYPTGNPIVQSAYELRESLLTAGRVFEGEGSPTFNKMVVVGHSMGGILTRLMLMDSDGSAWPEFGRYRDKELMKRMEFEAVPYVGRAIFMAAPHRGAIIANTIVGKVGKSLISFPGYFLQSVNASISRVGLPPDLIPTGIDNLSPQHSFMRASNSLKMRGDVPYHTIVGNFRRAGVVGGTDGVVSYESSHLSGAQSELIVKSGHTVQETYPAIAEVRRILLLHGR